MEKLRRLVFKSMAHELKGPSQKKKGESDKPESMEEDTGKEDNDGEQNERYAQRMAGTVDGILMAGRILRDPLLAATSAQHGRDHTPIGRIVEIQKRDESCWEYASLAPLKTRAKIYFVPRLPCQSLKASLISARRKNRKMQSSAFCPHVNVRFRCCLRSVQGPYANPAGAAR